MRHHKPKPEKEPRKRSIMETRKVRLTPEQVERLKQATRYVSVSGMCREYWIHYVDFFSWAKGTPRPLKEHKKYLEFCKNAFHIDL